MLTKRSAIAAAVIALALGACGDDDDDGAEPAATGADTTAGAPTTGAEGTAPPATTGTTAAGGATTSGPGGTAAASGEPIRIGVSLPLTGDFSEPGKGIQQGYDVWAADVNEAGGLLGRPVELIYRDDASDVNKVISDYEQLITVENVDFVFGPFSTRLVVPASEVAEQEGMLFLEPAGAAPEVFDRGLEYLFYTAPAVADDHYNYLAEYLLALPEGERPETAAYASLDDPFAQGTAYGLRDKLEEAGIETVADEVYPPGTTDYSTIAATVADADADIFVGGTQFEDSVGMIRAFQELGYSPDFAAFSTGPTLPEFAEALGDGVNGILSPVGWHAEADYPTNPEFVESFRERTGEEPHEDGANGYTVGQILVAAVEAVGCADASDECQTQLRDYIRENEFETVVGPLSFDDTGAPEQAHMIQQWIEGEVEIVLPADTEVQTAELVYPKPEW
jgi:branched-chain amino acid transport system substrate-binding protein